MILSNDLHDSVLRLDEKIYEELEKLRRRMEAKEKEQTYGLDRKKQMPITRGQA